MPLTQILPKVEPTYFQRAAWPDYKTFTINDPITGVNLTTRKQIGDTTSASNWWSAPFSSGTGTDTLQFYRERMCLRFTGGTGDRGRDFAVDWPLSFPMEFSEGAFVLEQMRVMWDSFFLAKDVGVDSTNNTGVRYVLRSGTVTPTWPNNGYGLFGRDNGWRWRAYNNAGALLESVDLTWPVPVDEYARVDILNFAATPLGAASVQLFVNGVNLLSRSFAAAAGPVLPSWQTGGLAGSLYIQRRINAGASMQVYATNMRYLAGKYDFGGAEIG